MYVPLPDERPRQTVANLIGRFENQVKRQPSSSPASNRSLSVVSHTSGDSAAEEAKERRDWPPKSTSPDIKQPILIPSSSFAQSLAAAQASSGATLTSATHSDGSVVNVDVRTPRPSSVASNSDKPDLAIVPPQRELSIDVTAPTPVSSETPITAKPPATAKPAKTPTISTSRIKPPTASARTPLKATAPRPSVTPATQPLKPQNTAPSLTSSTTRKPITKPTPTLSTPSSAKHPPRASSATPRPKTPSTARSKTPSSGLFAPTAASLAKSRIAQPPLPTPAKKPTLSSASAERLSKPTAASLSRARTPTSATPARASVKPATSANSATRGASTVKPRTNTGGLPVKKTGGTGLGKPAVSATVAATTVVASASIVESPQENGHQEDHVDEHPEDAVHEEEHLTEEPENVIAAEDAAQEGHLSGHVVEEPTQEPELVPADAEPEVESHNVPTVHTEEPEEVSVNGDHLNVEADAEPKAGNDIEDMVNMLESVSLLPKERPVSIISIPDEIHDIPDEE